MERALFFCKYQLETFFDWYFERENEENRMRVRFNLLYHDESLDAVRV